MHRIEMNLMASEQSIFQLLGVDFEDIELQVSGRSGRQNALRLRVLS